jgi:hypothetical protein
MNAKVTLSAVVLALSMAACSKQETVPEAPAAAAPAAAEAPAPAAAPAEAPAAAPPAEEKK